MGVKRMIAAGLFVACGAGLACAQHSVGSVGGMGGGHVGGSPHITGVPHGQFRGGAGGVGQRYSGAPRLQGYRPGLGSGVPTPQFAVRGRRDGDRDGDDRRGGREWNGGGYGRGARFGYGGRYGGPYSNPYGYGYGYPYIYSGLTYAGDLGYGDGLGNDGGYAQGPNADDANNGSAYDSSGQDGGYNDGQPPVPYTQNGQADEGPAGYGYDNGMTYPSDAAPAGAGYSGSGYGAGTPYQGGQGPAGSAVGTSESQNRGTTTQTDDAGSFDPTDVTLVFKDGRPQETIHNYALTRTTLYVTDTKRQVIPVSDLDLEATEKVNAAAGVKFQLPQ